MKTMLLTAVALTAAAPALAQTEPTPPVGPRIEARVGFDRVVLGVHASDDLNDESVSGGKSGVTYGGEIGYDLRAGQYATIGVYAGIEGASTKECTELYGSDEACLKAGRNITAGVRAGYMFSRTGLLYVKGGYTNGRLRLTYRDATDGSNNFDEGTNRDGFHVGAGAEMGFSRNFYGKLEYVYTNYNSFDVDDGTTSGNLDFDRHQVVAGFGVRF